MNESQKMAAIECLMSSDPTLELNPRECDGAMLVDLLMDRIGELEVDYSILSNAFVNRVHPDKFEFFHDAVMAQYDQIGEGQEIPEPVLDKIALQFR